MARYMIPMCDVPLIQNYAFDPVAYRGGLNPHKQGDRDGERKENKNKQRAREKATLIHLLHHLLFFFLMMIQ